MVPFHPTLAVQSSDFAIVFAGLGAYKHSTCVPKEGRDITCSCSDSPEDIGPVVSSSTCTCLCQAPVQLSCISMKGTVTKVTITAAPSFTFGALLALWRCGVWEVRSLSW